MMVVTSSRLRHLLQCSLPASTCCFCYLLSGASVEPSWLACVFVSIHPRAAASIPADLSFPFGVVTCVWMVMVSGYNVYIPYLSLSKLLHCDKVFFHREFFLLT